MTRPLARLALLIVLVQPACAAKRQVWDDPSLPEASEAVEAAAPSRILQDGAGSDDPSVRGRALELLLRTADRVDEAGYARRALWDPDPWVQSRAVEALGERLDEAAAVELLTDFVRRSDDLASPYARSAAALRLHRAGHDGFVDALSAAWRQEPRAGTAAPLQLAALVLGDAEAEAPLARALATGDVALEPGFLLDVGRSGQAGLVDDLAAGADWVEPEMHLAYAVARLLLGDDRGAQLVQRALDGDDALAAFEALDYLTAVEDEAADRLVRKARRGGTERTRTYADLALAAGGDGDPDDLGEAMLDPDPEIRALAARFAGLAPDRHDKPRKAARTARKVVETALGDEALEVRVAALRAAGRLGMDGLREPVEERLRDEYQAVRIEAAGALLQAGS